MKIDVHRTCPCQWKLVFTFSTSIAGKKFTDEIQANVKRACHNNDDSWCFRFPQFNVTTGELLNEIAGCRTYLVQVKHGILNEVLRGHKSMAKMFIDLCDDAVYNRKLELDVKRKIDEKAHTHYELNCIRG